MPEINAETSKILSKLDQRNTFLLDVGFKEHKKEYPGVYQNFEKDIYSILMSNKKLISKYKRLFLVFPGSTKTKDIITGFRKFSKTKTISTAVIHKFNTDDVKKQDAFIVIDDNDLVEIVKYAKSKDLQLGKDIGIISYNETSLKSVIGNGITTITTDFEAMGKSMAEMIITGERHVAENPFRIIDRQSF